MVWVYFPAALKKIPAWVFAGLVAAALAWGRKAIRGRKPGRAFALSSAAFLGLWGLVGSILYPNLVRASDPARSLTIYNASSSLLTLRVMLIIALTGMPFVVAYTIYVYRVFRAPAGQDEAGY